MGTCSLSFLFLTIVSSVSVKALTVSTKNGIMNGTVFKTSRGRIVNAFLGIPYAKPPILENRFKEPQPFEKWDGIRNAQNYGTKCAQIAFNTSDDTRSKLGEEDCLYLNIFTPTVSNKAKLNVIFFIHPGAFMSGSGDQYQPGYLLNDLDIVFVTINYRLGPFGFLTTGDEVIPGNNGLKDQVLALKWVKDNIEQFGGDKDKITITGLSAGGSSVHFHYLSNLSRDLFNQGISMSGTALNSWALFKNPCVKAVKLASAVGCPTDTSIQLLECLKTKDAKTLLRSMQQIFMPFNINFFSPFGPVVEPNSTTAFITRHPSELLSEGDVKDAPWLLGMTTDEGLYPGAVLINDDQLLQMIDKQWNKVMPYLLNYEDISNQEELNEMSEQIRKFYFKNIEIDTDSKLIRKDLIKMLSEGNFADGIERSARRQAKVTKSPVFLYRFGYRGKHSVSALLSKRNDNLGVCHGDDSLYVISNKWGLSTADTPEDQAMEAIMVRMWSSFVEEGVPSVANITWTPVSPNRDEISFLHISSPLNIQPRTSKDLSNHHFWKSLSQEETLNIREKQNKIVDEL